jgi:hypothetical protein
MSSRLDEQVAEFRAVRRKLEESILPFATSVDGRRLGAGTAGVARKTATVEPPPDLSILQDG